MAPTRPRRRVAPWNSVIRHSHWCRTKPIHGWFGLDGASLRPTVNTDRSHVPHVAGAWHHCERNGGGTTIDLRIDGELGELDAIGSLQFLLLLAEVAEAALPEAERLAMTGVRAGSAVVEIDPVGVDDDEAIERIDEQLQRPATLTRDLRSRLHTSYEHMSENGITGASFMALSRSTTFDEEAHQRVVRSLERPTQWVEVVGEVVRLGKTQAGRITGRISDDKTRRALSFDAPMAIEDSLRPLLFKRAALSGPADVDVDGHPTALVVEHAREVGRVTRLADFESGDEKVDGDAALARLIELRRG